jgi:hypothetical protein
VLIALISGVHGYLLSKDKWKYSKFVPYALFPLIGAVVEFSYVTFCEELLPAKVFPLSVSNTILFSLIATSIYPYLDAKRNSNELFEFYSYAMGGGALMCAFFFAIFTFETQSKSRKYINRRLRGKPYRSPS